MDGAAAPAEGVAAIYAGSMLVLLGLVSAAQKRARFADMFILAPGILLLHIIGAGFWGLVVNLMAYGLASTSVEQVVVLTTFTYGALIEMDRQAQLSLEVGFDSDLFLAVSWAQLLVIGGDARDELRRLSTASARELEHDLSLLYVQLVLGPTVILPSELFRYWIRLHHFLRRRIRDAWAGTVEPTQAGADPPPAASVDTSRFVVTTVRLFHATLLFIKKLPGTVYNTGILLASLPLLLLFFCFAGLQYGRAILELTWEVGLPRARLHARRWLRDSFLASPDLFIHCSAAQLWALSSTVDEVQARELLLAMTLPPGRARHTWTIADGHEALNGICGAGPNRRPMGTFHAYLYRQFHGGRLPGVPSNRQLLFTFVLAAVNMDPDGAAATASAGVPPPLAGDRSPLDDAIRGDGVALAALYRSSAMAVGARWAVVEAELRDGTL